MLLGIDAGTSLVKAVLFDEHGEAVVAASRPAPSESPAPGFAEQDLEAVLRAIGETVRDLPRETRQSVALVGVAAHGDGLWLLDAAGAAVRPGILWSDARAAAVVAEWNRAGIAERAFRVNGGVPFPGAAAPLLRFLEAAEPESLDRAATAGYLDDALVLRLTGARATDASDASLPFLDPRVIAYSAELLGLYGLGHLAHLLPPIDPAPGRVRPLTAEGAEVIGLPIGTPVHVGPFDFPATIVGAGLTEPGDALIALGTTLATGVLVDRIETGGPPSGMTVCLPRPERWIRLLPAMAGTLALDWALPLIGAGHDELDDLLRASNPGAGGIVMLPYLAPAGERAPFVDPEARGRLIGLRTTTTRADLARAVCEGIAYAARHCLDAGGLTPGGRVWLTGGGAKTAGLRRVLADVLGRPVLIARQPETGARGAVMAALDAAGQAFDHAAWTRPDGIIEPDPALGDLYERGFRTYLDEIERARAAWGGPV